MVVHVGIPSTQEAEVGFQSKPKASLAEWDPVSKDQKQDTEESDEM